MGVADWADGLFDRIDSARAEANALFEPTLRLGITGLSGAGKTVFITGLVASLLDRSRMRLLKAAAEGRIEAAMLRPQPDPEMPRFAYETHLSVLDGDPPAWPESTRSVSQLRISLRYRPAGIMGLFGPSVLHLDIVDYPGEWLLDLPLIEQDYETWAEAALATARSDARAPHAEIWHRSLDAADPKAEHDEVTADGLATAYRGYLGACRRAGLSSLAPGRFLLPGELDGSPALTFVPLPNPGRHRRNALYAQMRERFDAYKRVVVKPFFRNHFARLDRQVVLIDALAALSMGPRALGDLTATMAETLGAFRHGQSSWLDRLLGGRKIDRLLFAASKADHLHHEQHPELIGLIEGMLAEAARRAEWSGTETRAMALSAIRATAEQEIQQNGETIRLVRGPRLDDRKEVALYPGALPRDVAAVLAEAQTAAPGSAPPDWPDAEYAAVRFAPPRWRKNNGKAPPHIRLDTALDFLIGDKLR
ncbi:MAG: YcjX family protein [Pseudomonadota bacterium]